MPMLGDILAAARASSGAFAEYLERTDHDTARRIATVAAARGESSAGFVRRALADFGREASEEDWATLFSSLRDAEDPGRTCLFAMVEWRLGAEQTAGGAGEVR